MKRHVGEPPRLAIDQVPHVVGKVFSRGEQRPSDEDRHDGNLAGERGRDLDPDEIIRYLKPLELPVLANHRQKDVAAVDLVGDEPPEVDPGRDPVLIEKTASAPNVCENTSRRIDTGSGSSSRRYEMKTLAPGDCLRPNDRAVRKRGRKAPPPGSAETR